MQKILAVIYYQFYLFYKVNLKSDDPHIETTWGLGAAFSLIINFTFLIVKDFYFCYKIKTELLFGTGIFIVFLFHKYFSHNNRKYKIVKEKPLLNNNEILSKWIAISFFIFTIFIISLGIFLGKYFHDLHCK